MAKYWLSFRIADREAGGRTYNERYDDFKNAVEALATTYWNETTSFYVFESQFGLIDLTRALQSQIHEDYDLFIIRELDRKAGMICGDYSDPSIFTLMPYLQKA